MNKIIIVSDHIEIQKKRNSILNVYYELSKDKHNDVFFISTGFNLLRFIYKKIPLNIFFKYFFTKDTIFKIIFPLNIFYSIGLKKYFKNLWVKPFVDKIIKLNPDIVIFEAGTPSIIFSKLINNGINYRYIYRINDPINCFRENTLILESNEFIIHNNKVDKKVSVPHKGVSNYYDQVLSPALSSEIFALKYSDKKKISYIGAHPLPESFIRDVHNRFPDYDFYFTGSNKKICSKSYPLGIVRYNEIANVLNYSKYFIMYFPDLGFENFLNSNKMVAYYYLDRPIICNIDNEILKKNGIFSLNDEVFNYVRRGRDYLTWGEFSQKLID